MQPIVLLVFRENINSKRTDRCKIVKTIEKNFKNDKRICRIAKNAGTVIANGTITEILDEFRKVLFTGLSENEFELSEVRYCAFPIDIENSMSIGYDCDAYLPIYTFPY